MAEFGESSGGFERGSSARPASFAPSPPPRRPSVASTASAPNSARPSQPDTELPPSSNFDGEVTGRGTVLIESRKPPRVLELNEDQKLAVRADDVVGWIGRLLGHPLELESASLKAPGFVAFSGSGSVLVDLG